MSPLQRRRERRTTGSGIDVVWSVFGDGCGHLPTAFNPRLFLNSLNVVGTLSLWMYMTRFFFPSIFAITWTFFSFLFVFFSFVFRSFLFFFAGGPWSVSFFPLHFLPLTKKCVSLLFKKKWFFPVSHSLDYFCKYRNISEKSRLGQLTTSELFRFSL